MMQKEVKKIIQDMQDLKIQGATNTAMAVMETLGRYVVDVKGDLERVKIDLEQTAYSLAKARATEPLARNAVRYVLAEVKDAITLEAIRDMLAELTDQYLIVEFVGPGDEMFQSFLSARENLYANLTVDRFLSAFGERFKIIERQQVTDHRLLLACGKL